MLEELKNEANLTLTENGAKTFASTTSDVLDLFATIGALRRASEEDINSRFVRAWAEDRDLAMKLLFYARDVRGGLGERRVFRTVLRMLATSEPASVRKNIQFIGEFGRYDDLLTLIDTPCEGAAMEYIGEKLRADMEDMEAGRPVSLLAKWLPSVNASSAYTRYCAKKVARAVGMSERDYRKALSALRERIAILENYLRERDYTFDYEKQPSKALFKYRKAFDRNDHSRYQTFLKDVASGKAVLHTGTLTPYDIIAPAFKESVTEAERRTMDATWNAQEDFTSGENALVVVDGSGSMYSGEPLPAAVALSLGIYFGERNTGAFKNHFITFSTHPRLVEIKGEDIFDKVRYCASFNEVSDTNLQAVFQLILTTAVKNKLPQSELPAKLYIITDMEFNYCTEDAGLTNFTYAKELFEQYGYSLPRVVFWNVDSRSLQQPVTKNEQGVTLISGCTPRIFSMLANDTLDPYAAMIYILTGERYAPISA